MDLDKATVLMVERLTLSSLGEDAQTEIADDFEVTVTRPDALDDISHAAASRLNASTRASPARLTTRKQTPVL